MSKSLQEWKLHETVREVMPIDVGDPRISSRRSSILKGSSDEGIKQFKKRNKLSPKYNGPFENP